MDFQILFIKPFNQLLTKFLHGSDEIIFLDHHTMIPPFISYSYMQSGKNFIASSLNIGFKDKYASSFATILLMYYLSNLNFPQMILNIFPLWSHRTRWSSHKICLGSLLWKFPQAGKINAPIPPLWGYDPWQISPTPIPRMVREHKLSVPFFAKIHNITKTTFWTQEGT